MKRSTVFSTTLIKLYSSVLRKLSNGLCTQTTILKRFTEGEGAPVDDEFFLNDTCVLQTISQRLRTNNQFPLTKSSRLGWSAIRSIGPRMELIFRRILEMSKRTLDSHFETISVLMLVSCLTLRSKQVLASSDRII
uniref:Uncharacterized protein n=1 Tax=Glossina pallidipes TaxID=7398 RepID=A0A1B0AIV0_GLOPL